MPTTKSINILSLLLLTCITANATEQEKSSSTEPNQSSSLMIIFYPPPGRESEFLNVFVKNQSDYMKKYTDMKTTERGTKSINIAPTKNGEPLIHLMIYRDQEAYNKAVETFSSREQLVSYLGNHTKLYGGQNIESDFLKYSKVHFGEIIGAPFER
jgi:hypothetical protein